MRHELINRNNLILVSIYFIAFVIIYGSSLVKNGYHFDEIADFTNNMMIQYIAQQRWGLSLFRYLAGASATPWASGVFCGICFSIAMLLQTKILNITNSWLQLAYGIAYLAVPQTSTFFIFSIQIDAIASAILLISAIIYCFTNSPSSKWIKYSIAVIILAYALACYQTLVIYYAILCTGWLISELLKKRDDKTTYQTYLWVISIIIPALILYFLISKALLITFDIPEEYLSFIKNYRKDTIPVYSMEDITPIKIIIYAAQCFKLAILSFCNLSRSQIMYTACIIPVTLLIICTCISKNKFLNKLIIVTISIIIYITPHAQTLLFMKATISHPGMLSVPLSCAILCTLTVQHTTVLKSNKFGIFSTVLLLLSCVNTMYLNNGLTNRIKLQYEAENARMNCLLQAAYRTAAEAGINMNSNRIILFSNYPVYYDYLKFHPQWGMFYVADIEEFCEYEKELANMNAWPAVNSVKAVNNRILIKLMDSHYQLPNCSPQSTMDHTQISH